jgi:hypothetical protein
MPKRQPCGQGGRRQRRAGVQPPPWRTGALAWGAKRSGQCLSPGTGRCLHRLLSAAAGWSSMLQRLSSSSFTNLTGMA